MKSATLRAGLRSAILAIKEIGEDLNNEQVLTLQHNVFRFDEWGPSPAASNVWAGRRTAGFAEKMYGTGRHVTPPTVANAIYELCMGVPTEGLLGAWGPGGAPLPEGQRWNRRQQMRCVLNRATADNWPNSCNEAYQGIEIGSFALTPNNWMTAWEVSSSCIQLRYNFNPEQFELVINDLTDVPQIIVTDLQPRLNPTVLWDFDVDRREFCLDYEPNLASPAQSTVRAWIGGILVHTLVGGRLANLINGPDGFWGGYFVTAGTLGATMNETGFERASFYVDSILPRAPFAPS
jgi:hypothetical protein